jgi:hypothetical protein
MSLAEEIAELPAEMQQEVADFVGYLRQKKERQERTDAVERSLKAAEGFHGLGAEIWQDTDPDQYVADLRADLQQTLEITKVKN